MTSSPAPPARGLRVDWVLVFLRTVTVVGIVILLTYRGRLAMWEKPLQSFLGACLLAMGLWQFRRLTARGWWKGNWRDTLRAQRHEEWAALLVAVNVFFIGLICLAVVAGGWAR